MAQDFNINVNLSGASSKPSAGGFNTKMTNKGFRAKGKTVGSLKGLASAGLAFRTTQMGNEVFGAYTENRLQQRKNQVAITGAKYAYGIAMNPALGLTYMATDLAYRGVQYNIGIQKQNREANYYKSLSGNNTNSGSRYRGDYT